MNTSEISSVNSSIFYKPTILVVDDKSDNLMIMNNLLKEHYRVKVANHGSRALKIAATLPQPDLILLDIMMPEIDGYTVCKTLKSDPLTQNIPIIFLTAKNESSDEEQGLALGASDYITKPISPPIVLARIRTHLQVKKFTEFLQDKNQFLENEVQRRTSEIVAIQDVCIHALASLAETRDNETGSHIRRTQNYIKFLALELQHQPKYNEILNEQNIELLFKSAPLHDIGKVGIPDQILLKPDRLTGEEFQIMKKHAEFGVNALDMAEKALGKKVSFLTFAKEIAYSHHEKWDGSGYPLGLSGEEIPLSARLMAVADVYDALISRRVYKPAFPHEQAIEIITSGAGSHFDQNIINAFIKVTDQFNEIAEKFKDIPHEE